MTEFNKIIRYLFPVFIFMGYTFLFISLMLLPDYFFYELINNSSVDSAFLLAFAGGTGFGISLIHHYLFWNLRFYPKTKYRNFLKMLRKSGLLVMKSDEKSLIYSKRTSSLCYKTKLRERKYCLYVINKKRRKIGEMDNWRILNIIWHRLRYEDTSLEKVNSRNDSLTDLMHANGSSFVALLLAVLTTIIYIYYYNTYIEIVEILNNEFFFLAIGIFVIAFFLHFKSYKFSVQNLNRFFEDALFHSLLIRSKQKSGTNSKKRKGPLKFYINRSELSD